MFVECCKLGHPWLGLIHDLSKFRLSEWLPYAEHFYGKDAAKRRPEWSDPAFDMAWLHHQHRNKHHWQYWLQVTRRKKVAAFEMPIKYLEEMLADWVGAAKAKGQGGIYTVEWYERYKDTMILEPRTRKWIEGVVDRMKES